MATRPVFGCLNQIAYKSWFRFEESLVSCFHRSELVMRLSVPIQHMGSQPSERGSARQMATSSRIYSLVLIASELELIKQLPQP
jgi:hypothetical protein